VRGECSQPVDEKQHRQCVLFNSVRPNSYDQNTFLPVVALGVVQGNRSAHRTLRAWEVDVLSKANYWEQNKKQRMAEFEDLQVSAAAARAGRSVPGFSGAVAGEEGQQYTTVGNRASSDA
jgi:hypothetical protein